MNFSGDRTDRAKQAQLQARQAAQRPGGCREVSRPGSSGHTENAPAELFNLAVLRRPTAC